MTTYCEIATPIGPLLLSGGEEGLSGISFPSGRQAAVPGAGWRRADEPFRKAISEIEAYFAGELTRFTVPIAPRGTPFQLEVWAALRTIPYGETATYGDIARRLGRPRAFRAVGAANGRNPIPIVIPCHRVVGTDGSLTGFGGGLPIKRALLSLESRRGGAAPAATALLPFEEER
jgi:methylated-DNA-[protein]-cysteine S-methyltransferase